MKNCVNCGKTILDDAVFCKYCGKSQKKFSKEPLPEFIAPELPQDIPCGGDAPLSSGFYMLLEILFRLPIIGFILSIVFSFVRGNKNRRNLARAYLILSLIVIAVLAVLCVLFRSALLEFLYTKGILK